MINHCDRHITLLGDTDTVVSHSMINPCDRRDISLFLVILIQQSDTNVHSIINHCDRRITLLSDTDTVQSET